MCDATDNLWDLLDKENKCDREVLNTGGVSTKRTSTVKLAHGNMDKIQENM